MDKISKALKKFNNKEKQIISFILKKIKSHKLNGFDIRKLKNRDNIFRIRKGKIRIIYLVDERGEYKILAIERRNDNTYNFY